MKLRSIVFGTALFAAGVSSADRVRHKLASMQTKEHVPTVSVRYSGGAAFVNGLRVYDDRIGEARCDWDSIDAGMREHYALSEFQQNPRAIADYLRDSPSEDRRRFVYFGLVQMARDAESSVAAELDSLRANLGIRAELPWKR